MSPRGRIVVAVVTIGIVATFVTVVARHDAPSTMSVGSSLRASPPHGDAVKQLGGGEFTDGMELLQLTGGVSAIKILRVRLIEPRGTSYLGSKVIGPQRKVFQFFVSRGFPSRFGVGAKDAVGATIGPNPRGWELLVGAKASRTGFSSFKGVEVDYETPDGHRFRQELLGEVLICADRSVLKAGECRPPGQAATN